MSTNKGYMKAYNSIAKPNSKSQIKRQAELSARPPIAHSCSVCGAHGPSVTLYRENKGARPATYVCAEHRAK